MALRNIVDNSNLIELFINEPVNDSSGMNILSASIPSSLKRSNKEGIDMENLIADFVFMDGVPDDDFKIFTKYEPFFYPKYKDGIHIETGESYGLYILGSYEKDKGNSDKLCGILKIYLEKPTYTSKELINRLNRVGIGIDIDDRTNYEPKFIMN